MSGNQKKRYMRATESFLAEPQVHMRNTAADMLGGADSRGRKAVWNMKRKEAFTEGKLHRTHYQGHLPGGFSVMTPESRASTSWQKHEAALSRRKSRFVDVVSDLEVRLRQKTQQVHDLIERIESISCFAELETQRANSYEQALSEYQRKEKVLVDSLLESDEMVGNVRKNAAGRRLYYEEVRKRYLFVVDSVIKREQGLREGAYELRSAVKNISHDDMAAAVLAGSTILIGNLCRLLDDSRLRAATIRKSRNGTLSYEKAQVNTLRGDGISHGKIAGKIILQNSDRVTKYRSTKLEESQVPNHLRKSS
jgi:hypothetical protein